MAVSQTNFKQAVSVEVIRASPLVTKSGYLKKPVICESCGNKRTWLIRCEYCGTMVSLEEKTNESS